MKKFYLLTKTLLVAVLLMVGASNVWGQTPTLGVPSTFALNALESPVPFDQGAIVSGTNVKAWSKNTDDGVTANAWFDSDAGTDGNQPYTLSEDETVTISFTAYEGWNSGAGSSTVKLLNSGGVSLAEYTYTPNTCYVKDVSFNGTTAEGYADFMGQSKNGTKDANGFNNAKQPYVTTANYNPTVTFTVSDNGYVTFTFVSANAGTQSFNATLPTSGGSAVTMDLARIQIIDNSPTSDTGLGISNLSITSEVVAKHTVTFTYEDTDGNSLSALKANSTVQAAEGTSIEGLISDAMKTSFYSGDASIRYVYSTFAADGDATTVPTSDITVKLKFAPKAKFTYNVYAVNSSSVKLQEDPIATASAYADETATLKWSKYINIGGTWYSTSEATFLTTATEAGSKNVVYSTSDITYFFEAENMTYSKVFNTYEGDAASNGIAKTLYSDANAKTATTVAAGVYTISLNGKKWGDKNDNYRVSYSTDGTSWVTLGDIAYADDEEGVKTFAGAIIPTAAYIRIWTTQGSQTPRRYLDYMTLQKTAEIPSSENIVVTSAGYATYVSNYNLNFTSATTKAYKVSVAEKGVATMTLVDEVPAKTPVLLYVAGGNGDGETIPVTTDVVSAVSGNNLVAGTGAAVATDDGDYTNMILNNVSGIGFYFAAGQTVATNRAYLHIADDMAPAAEATARGMILEFADEKITGINEAAAATEAVQKEGKFVVDGKLVIFKKGMKFNANGARIY